MDPIVELIQALYSALGIEVLANTGDLLGLTTVLLIGGASALRFFAGRGGLDLPRGEESPTEAAAQAEPELVVTPNLSPETPPQVSFKVRLTQGLSRSRNEIWGKIGGLFRGRKMNQEVIDEIEELLYGADLGPKMVQDILSQLEEHHDQELSEEDFKGVLLKYLDSKMAPVQKKQETSLYNITKNTGQGPKVVMIVGVNGAGKTTTIGKLATKLTREGAKVVVGACDTFRAAAVDQLQVWCERSGAEMIRAKEGANPSGVGYDALQAAISQQADYCLLDTAGRLHTKENLMEELKKSKNVLAKLDPNAPHEVLLVLDAITGQNALKQAQEFNKALGLTGLIFTKCDGSSKAGSAIGIVDDLQVPLTYIGVGEGVDDLDQFNLDQYLKALVDWDENAS